MYTWLGLEAPVTQSADSRILRMPLWPETQHNHRPSAPSAQVIHRIITITILVLSLKWQKSNSVAQSKPDQDLPHARAERRANVIWWPHHWWPHRASERCYAIWGMFGSQTTSCTIASTELPRSQFNLNFKFGFFVMIWHNTQNQFWLQVSRCEHNNCRFARCANNVL